MNPARAQDLEFHPAIVRFSAQTEPLIELILKTPREQSIETIVREFGKGLPYRHFLAALYLTAIRAGQWHANPFDHNAYVVHSAHQLSLDLPAQEMLFPSLWALDNLKARPLDPISPPIRISGKFPQGAKAASEVRKGIEERDEDRAVRGIIGLNRSAGASRVGESIWEVASRDWTFIGHLSILASNSWRLLQTIGWQHSEPVLRYVISGFTGAKGSQPDLKYLAENTARVDRNWRALPEDWAAAGAEPALTRELLSLIRLQKADDACDLAVSRLVAGKTKADAVWDAVFLSAGEMIACTQKNSTPLHANTAANALRYAFSESGNSRTRLLIVLQALAWMTRFRAGMAEQGWLKVSIDITSLASAKIAADNREVAQNILENLSHGGMDHGEASRSPVPGWHGLSYNYQPWRREAADQAFALAHEQGGTQILFELAARMLVSKADGDPHRIKFATAMFENYQTTSPAWRPHLAAAATYSFLGADAPETSTIVRAREAIKRL
jgi:hypothetical protein